MLEEGRSQILPPRLPSVLRLQHLCMMETVVPEASIDPALLIDKPVNRMACHLSVDRRTSSSRRSSPSCGNTAEKECNWRTMVDIETETPPLCGRDSNE